MSISQIPIRFRVAPKVFVVSLKRTPERTQQAVENLVKLGLRFEVVPACDGMGEEGMYFPRDPRTTYIMQPGECGISMSFAKVCSMIIRDNLDWGIYMEDDIEVLHKEGLVSALKSLPEDFHFAALSDSNLPEPEVIPSNIPEPWNKVSHPSFATVAYLISNEGARQCLKHLFPIDRPIDVWLRDNDQSLNIYQVKNNKAWFTQSFWRPSTARTNGVRESIPKIIHRVWVGDDTIPAEFETFWSNWKKHHPGYEFKTWGNKELEESGILEKIPKGLPWAAYSDFLRLHALIKDGGLYVDCDFDCFHSFDKLIEAAGMLALEESPNLLCNGMIGAYKNHPEINAMMANAIERINGGMEFFYAAGPANVRHVLDEWRNPCRYNLYEDGHLIAQRHADTGLIIIDYRTCFSYYWAEESPSNHGRCWAVHHWARSWWTEQHWNDFYAANPNAPKKRFS